MAVFPRPFKKFIVSSWNSEFFALSSSYGHFRRTIHVFLDSSIFSLGLLLCSFERLFFLVTFSHYFGRNFMSVVAESEMKETWSHLNQWPQCRDQHLRNLHPQRSTAQSLSLNEQKGRRLILLSCAFISLYTRAGCGGCCVLQRSSLCRRTRGIRFDDRL